VPYKGSGPALTDTVAGHVNMMMDVVMTSEPYIRDGRLRPLAVTSAARSAMLPDVPTVAEQGYPGFEAIVWFGLFAPAGMPNDLAARLSNELVGAVNGPRLSKYLREQGAMPSSIARDEFAALIRADIDKWAGVARAAGIKPE
jgi:tripartite-type tricarboxylate transporter receptor subunit TctC